MNEGNSPFHIATKVRHLLRTAEVNLRDVIFVQGPQKYNGYRHSRESLKHRNHMKAYLVALTWSIMIINKMRNKKSGEVFAGQ